MVPAMLNNTFYPSILGLSANSCVSSFVHDGHACESEIIVRPTHETFSDCSIRAGDAIKQSNYVQRRSSQKVISRHLNAIMPLVYF
jgi:hypothetical protein